MRQNYERISAVITIVNRGRGDAVIKMMRSKDIPYNVATIGYTFMGLELADYFGFTEIKRDIIISVVPEKRVPETLTMLEYGFSLDAKRTGIAFCVPVSSVAGLKVLQYITGAVEIGKDEPIMEKDYQSAEYRLIITIVGRGHADTVMDAAKTAGARGGTVLYARGSGIHETETFMHVPIEPEKEIVLTLVKKSIVKDVMSAIRTEAGLDQVARGISFTLPVTDTAGIVTDGTISNLSIK